MVHAVATPMFAGRAAKMVGRGLPSRKRRTPQAHLSRERDEFALPPCALVTDFREPKAWRAAVPLEKTGR